MQTIPFLLTCGLLRSTRNSTEVSYLYARLDGPVLMPDWGMVVAHDAAQLLRSRCRSTPFRPDQHAFSLDSSQNLPGFETGNVVISSLDCGSWDSTSNWC